MIGWIPTTVVVVVVVVVVVQRIQYLTSCSCLSCMLRLEWAVELGINRLYSWVSLSGQSSTIHVSIL
jgi:hypothetical protein